MGKLPVLEDPSAFGSGPGAFLPESGAILRYLCRVFLSSKTNPFYHLYPHQDAAAAALVDAAVGWHFSALRPGCSGVVWALVLAKTVPRGGTARRAAAESPAAAAAALASLGPALDALEGGWLLSPEGGFLAGRGRLSIADLLVATEIDQLRLLEATRGGEGEGERGELGSGGGGDGNAAVISYETLLAPRPRTRAYLARVREACGPRNWDEVSSVLGRVVANLRKKRRGGGGGGGGRSEGPRQARL